MEYEEYLKIGPEDLTTSKQVVDYIVDGAKMDHEDLREMRKSHPELARISASVRSDHRVLIATLASMRLSGITKAPE